MADGLTCVRYEAVAAECEAQVAACDGEIGAVRATFEKQLTRLQLRGELLAAKQKAARDEHASIAEQRRAVSAARRGAAAECARRGAALRERRDEYGAARAALLLKQREVSQLRHVRRARAAWRAALARQEAQLAPRLEAVSQLEARAAEAQAAARRLEAARAVLREESATAASRAPELLQQKKAAVAARAFKEAGRLAAELKAAEAAEATRRERKHDLCAEAEANQEEQRLVSTALAEAEAAASERRAVCSWRLLRLASRQLEGGRRALARVGGGEGGAPAARAAQQEQGVGFELLRDHVEVLESEEVRLVQLLGSGERSLASTSRLRACTIRKLKTGSLNYCVQL